jgi:Xaa-Pro aminopeptidase
MSDTLLIYADSERDANMLYVTGMFVPDPFIYLRLGGKCHIVMSDLEIDRARQDAPHCKIISWARCQRSLEALGMKQATPARVIRHLLAQRGLRRVVVPSNFPLGLADELRSLKVIVKARPGLFLPDRETKCAEEVKKISAALIMAEVGLAEGLQALKNAKIGRNRRLMHRNNPLTSEKLRAIIDTAILQAGGNAANTIVAGGEQSVDPHERGRGVLRAHEPIIIDVFPRSQKTGYFGDITRTVVKGRASDAVRKMYDSVRTAQEIAFHSLRRGTPATVVHGKVQDLFAAREFKTGQHNGRMQGFFHSTGHGLGLELHEAPRIGTNSRDTLRTGQVVTVEPGLYYPGIGGVRLEDVALITGNGPRNLTKFEKILEL